MSFIINVFLCVYVCVSVYLLSICLHPLYTSLLSTGDAQRDSTFITYMSELPFPFRCRQDRTEPHFTPCGKSNAFGDVNQKTEGGGHSQSGMGERRTGEDTKLELY